MHKALLGLLLVSLLAGELLAWYFGEQFGDFEPAYRIFHLLQMALLIVLAAMIARGAAGGLRWLILAGLVFSLGGDLINSFLFDLSHIIEPQTLLSVVPFAIAHCLYITAFWRLGRSGPQPFPGALIVLTLLVWPVLAVSLWLILVDYEAGPLLKWLSLGYAHMVMLMALVSLWPLKPLGARAWLTAAGGLLFLLSDSFFGAWLTEAQARPLWVSQTIWVTYFLAQICIAHVAGLKTSSGVRSG